LHLAHATSIPFENLDIVLRQPISLEVDQLQAKLVDAHRGGCCFEQNGFFTAVLEQIGFKITRLAARVRMSSGRLVPRTHMLFMIEFGRERWIGDVGFGGWGLMEPIPLEVDRDNRQFGWTMRLRYEQGQWILRCMDSPFDHDQYAFTLDPQLPIDYEPANHYCSTHPQSRFMQTVGVQLPAREKRFVLRNNEFLTATPSGEQPEAIGTNEGVLRVLEERFGLRFPAGTVFGPIAEAIGAANNKQPEIASAS
jgi:N-hydroxyarylamine O-acetyltransferase